MLLSDQDTLQVPQRTVTLVMRDGEIYRSVVKLDQDRFQALTQNLSTEFTSLVDKGLKVMHLQDEDIGQVVLVGGGAQLFSIYHALEKRFAGIDLVLADNPDESVVLGSSLEYGAAAAKTRPSLLFIPEPDQSLPPGSTVKESTFRLESAEGEEHALVPGDNRVGRAPTNEVQLLGEKISRFHARIFVKEGGIEVFDLGSTNGTFLNESRLKPDQPSALQPGNEICFGDRRFKIVQSP